MVTFYYYYNVYIFFFYSNSLDLKSPKVGESPSANREHVDGFSDVIGGKGDDAFFVKVDLLMEGSKEDRKKAYTLLHESQEKVSFKIYISLFLYPYIAYYCRLSKII